MNADARRHGGDGGLSEDGVRRLRRQVGKETTRDLLSQLCEYTLHLDAFEQKLDEISSAERPETAVKNT